MRSDVSTGMGGRASTPMSIWPRVPLSVWRPLISSSTTACSSSPIYTLTMAGGASLAPRRWSLPALATEMRKRSWFSSTARKTAVRNSRNCAFSRGVLPGSSRFSPSSVQRAQLLCLPEPFTPSKGFSCKRQAKPWRCATFFSTSMASWFASMARLAVVNRGAISCWAGATSLCSVLAQMPSFHSSSSSSSRKAFTFGRIEPK